MHAARSQGRSRLPVWLGLAVLIGILQSQPEIAQAIADGGIDYANYVGSLWIKLPKDVFMVGLWVYLVAAVRDPFPPCVGRAVFACYLIIGVAAIWAILTTNLLFALAGIRWIIAALVLLELRRLQGLRFNAPRLARLATVLLLVHLALQLARLFYFPPVWGERWGLSARVPGFFLLPNTSALFACACAALVIDLTGRDSGASKITLSLAVLSALLSQSAGGLLACIALLGYILFRRWLVAVPLIALGASALLVMSAALLGRADFLEYSGGERFDKLLLVLSEIWGPGAFGFYTNTGFLLSISDLLAGNLSREPVVSDSFYVSLIGNFGLLSVPLAAAFSYALTRAARHVSRQRQSLGMASLLCLGVFSFSTVVSEAFPMTMMLAVGFWLGRPAVSKAAEPRGARPTRPLKALA